MSSPPQKKLKMEDVSTDTATEEVEKKTGVPTSVTVLKNHNVEEETWTKYDNTYRLSKTGCGMTLLKRVERLESQMESADSRLLQRKKATERQKQVLIDFSKVIKEEVKDLRFNFDFMNSKMNIKLDNKIDDLQDYTEKAIAKLTKRHLIMNDAIERCVESCTETLEIIKGEERERTVVLDNLI